MKVKTLITTLIVLMGCSTAFAFDPVTDCRQPLLSTDLLQGKITNYKTNGALQNDGSYVLCFDPASIFNATASINIQPADPLFIYGLSIQPKVDADPFDPMVAITGPNITLENVTLTGNGTGTAIQITATGSVTIQGTDANHSTTISGFTKGIEVANGGKLILGDNVTYKFSDNNVSMLDVKADDSPILANPVENAVSSKLIGGKKFDNDPDKIEFVMGALNPAICELENKGKVDMYIAIKFPKLEHEFNITSGVNA